MLSLEVHAGARHLTLHSKMLSNFHLQAAFQFQALHSNVSKQATTVQLVAHS